MSTRASVPRTVDELLALATRGEQRDVELKESVGEKGARKIAQAVAAMANLRDGGLVILGVEDKTFVLRGLSATEIAIWSDRDKARSAVNAWLEPAVDLESYRVGDCVVLEVRPFARTPIIARRGKGDPQQPDALIEGTPFYRSSATVASAPIARLEDWVELRETLLLQAQAGAKRLEDDRKRAEHEADEERIRELRRNPPAKTSTSSQPEQPGKLGILAIVRRNFRLAQMKAQQSEAKANLKAAYTALLAYFQEVDRYPPSLAAAGFQPHPGGRYVYRAVETEIVGAEQRTDRPELVAEGLRKLARYHAKPHIGPNTFLIMAVTRIEPERLIDLWVIDSFGDPRCITPETTSLDERRRLAWWDSLLATPGKPESAGR